jgi:hypothetical protein
MFSVSGWKPLEASIFSFSMLKLATAARIRLNATNAYGQLAALEMHHDCGSMAVFVHSRALVSSAAGEKKLALVLPDAIEFGPQGGGDDIIDDYRREGKRTPQQLLLEATVAKNYSRMKMVQVKKQHADLNRRLKLQRAAIAALPVELQEEARQPDMNFFPDWREPVAWEIVMSEALDDSEDGTHTNA